MNNKHSVIVEIQRRKGDSISYHHNAYKILDAAEGQDISDSEDTEPPNLISFTHPEDEGKDYREKAKQERDNALVALEIAGGLLKKDRLDANRLGMESLCLLTDPTKTGALTAILVSRVILSGSARPFTVQGEGSQFFIGIDEEECCMANDIRDAIMLLITEKRLGGLDDDEYTVVEIDDTVNLVHDRYEPRRRRRSHNAEHSDLLRNLALSTMANALKVVAKEGTLGETLKEVQPWLEGNQLVKALIDIMKCADTRPHDAHLSAKCLGSLVRASAEARERAKTLDAITVVGRALNIGERSHVALAKETASVKMALNSQA